MKFKNCYARRTVKIGDLKPGATFMRNRPVSGDMEYCMVVSPNDPRNIQAANNTVPVVTLNDGDLRFWMKHVEVFPIDTELSIL